MGTCETCRWWEVNRYGGVAGPGCDGSYSNCRRHAPVCDPTSRNLSGTARWPQTAKADWCGEHAPREQGGE